MHRDPLCSFGKYISLRVTVPIPKEERFSSGVENGNIYFLYWSVLPLYKVAFISVVLFLKTFL